MDSDMADAGNPRNATLYIKNLNERIKLPQLEQDLRALFAEFGDIVEIIAKKNLKARGQAFVVFDSADSAEMALEVLQGFDAHGKAMEISYARTRSDATVKREDSSEAFQEHKKKRIAIKERRQKAEALEREVEAKRAEAEEEELPTQAAKASKAQPSGPGAVDMQDEELLPPNKTLVVRAVPAGYKQEQIEELFGHLPGFRHVRMIAHMGIIFIEFAESETAAAAREAMNGKEVEGTMVRLVFQRA